MRILTYALSLVLIFFIPWEGVVRIPGLGTVAKTLGLGLAAVWVVTVVATGQLRKPGPFQLTVFLFVLWNASSIFWSADINRTKDQVVTWFQLLGLILVLWDLYTTRAAVLAGLQAYILGAYVAVGSALVNFFSGNVYYTNYERFSAGDTNPDGFGFILVLGIPIAWYLAVANDGTKMARWLKIVNYVYIPAALLGIALSGTRTAAIAAIPAMAFGLASLNRLKLWMRVAILLVLVAAIYYLLPVVEPLRSFERLGTTFTELTGGDLNQRTLIWEEGLRSFVEHPLLGVGSNMYRSVNSLGKVAHNSFISVLVEVGLIGLFLFGIILSIVIVRIIGQPKWDSRFWLTLLGVWAVGASTLTWEHRKQTWLFLSLAIASAALSEYRAEDAVVVPRIKPDVHLTPYAKKSSLPFIMVGVILVVTVISLLTLPRANLSGPIDAGPAALAGFDFKSPTPEHSPTATLSYLESLMATQAQTPQVSFSGIEGNCTFGVAHWLTYYDLWGVEAIQVGNLTLSREEARDLLSQDPTNVSTLLRQLLVVYDLNINNGTDPGAFVDTVLEIQAWLDARAEGGRLPEAERLRGLGLAKALWDFNEGVSGPGICPDYTDTPTATATSTSTPTPTLTSTPTRTPTRRVRSFTQEPTSEPRRRKTSTPVPTQAPPTQPPTKVPTQPPPTQPPPTRTPTPQPTPTSPPPP